MAAPTSRQPPANDGQSHLGRPFGALFSHLDFFIFQCFFSRFLIDPGPLRCLKTIEKHTRNSTFSCFEQVIILVLFLAPKTSLGATQIMCFGVIFSKVFLFFFLFFFEKWKSVWYTRHLCEVQFFQFFIIFIFCLNFDGCFRFSFFVPLTIIFFSFWPVLGTSKIDLWPSKVGVSSRRNAYFQKIMFFYKKHVPLKNTKNDSKNTSNKISFWALFGSRKLPEGSRSSIYFLFWLRGLHFGALGCHFAPPGSHFGAILADFGCH